MTDLERAIAVIADLCGAGRPAVKETKEELAEWAEEFVDRYFESHSIPDPHADDPMMEVL